MPEARPPARRRRRARLIVGAVLLLLVGLYFARDALVLRLARPALAQALRERWGARATWTSIDVDVAAGLARMDVRLRGLQLRAAAPAGVLTEADLEDVQATVGTNVVFGGFLEPEAVTIRGARLLLDARGVGTTAGRDSLPATLPVANVEGVTARIRLSDERTLLLEDATLRIRPPSPAPDSQPLDVQAGRVALADAEGELDLGALRASLGWRAGVLSVTGRSELAPPGGGTLALLEGSQLDLTDAAGPRLTGTAEVRRLRLDRLTLPGMAARPVELGADAQLDVPLRADSLPALLAGAQAELDVHVGRVDTADSLALNGRLANGVFEVDRAEASTSGGRLEVLDGRVKLASQWLDTEVEVGARAELSDLGPLGALLAPLLPGLPTGDAAGIWAGSLQGSVRASGPLRAPSFEVDVTGHDVGVAGWLAGDVTLQATGDRTLARVALFEMRAPDAEVRVRGLLDPGTLTVSDALVDVRLADDGLADSSAAHGAASLPVVLARRVLPGLAGELELHARPAGRLAEPTVDLEACAPELHVADLELRDVSLVATLVDGVLDVPALHAEVQGTRLQARGRVTGLPPAGGERVVQVDALRLARDGVALELVQPAELKWNGRLRLSPVDLVGPAGTVHLEAGEGPAPDGGMRHEVVARLREVHVGLWPEPLRPFGLRADRLDLDLHAAWNRDDTAPAAGEGVLATWFAGVSEIELQAELRAENPGLDAAGLRADGAVLRGELEGDPAAPRGFVLAGLDDMEWALPAVVGDLLAVLQETGEVQTERTPAPGEVVLVGSTGRIPGEPSEAPALRRSFGPVDVAGRAEVGRLLALQSLHLDDATGLRLDVGGTVKAPLDLRSALAGGRALPADAPLDMQLLLTTSDIAALRPWLGDVRGVAGEARVEGLLEGTVGSPRLTGGLRLVHGALLLASGLPELEALQMELALEGGVTRIVQCTGEMGAAPFRLAGRARLDGGADALDLRLTGEDLLLWRGQGVKVRADVDVTLRGPFAAPAASGRITLRDSRLVRNVNVLQLSRARPEGPAEPLFSFREPPLSRLWLDLRLEAAEPFRIENNVVRGGMVPDLHIGGTGTTPVIEGTIVMTPTRVALPGSVVRVTDGRLVFHTDQPGRPEVQLRGETRVRGWDITLQASGPYDEPLLELESTPPLPSEDVLLLVLTGQPPEGERDPTQAASAPGPVAVYLGQDLLARWLSETSAEGDDPEDKFEFDYAENVTTRGSTSLQVSYRLSGDAEGAGRALYLDAEKDPYDAVNFGLRWRFRLP